MSEYPGSIFYLVSSMDTFVETDFYSEGSTMHCILGSAPRPVCPVCGDFNLNKS